jgi:hypothetical protein
MLLQIGWKEWSLDARRNRNCEKTSYSMLLLETIMNLEKNSRL